jgi:phage FluMu protein gp41
MSEENKKTPPRKDRIRAKKGSHKLTERQVEMIRSQKGKMSVRQIAKWFAKKNHYQIKISPSMVHGILTGKMHKKEDKVSIYDLINEDVTDEELENLNPKDVKYE